MASDTSRSPSTENGGSRPPTSRFVEGSMNDRVSAAPPAQFLDPEQLKAYERQFYVDESKTQSGTHRLRRQRPFSESNAPEQEHIITHRKSTGFFGRVRDALGWSSSRGSNSPHKQDSARKHSSLQETPLSPRSEHLRAATSHPEMYSMPQLPNFGSGANRPSRDDVLQSYNQLMATGFFQSHAIQSSRHAGPGSRSGPPSMPTIPGSVPCSPQPPQPPPRVSSVDASVAPYSPPSPTRAGHHGRTLARLESSDELTAYVPKNKEFRYASIRGRKRNRPDADEIPNAEAHTEVPGASASSSFAQPLKRVAKKLRKMPSSARDVEMADAIVGLPPSTSMGGTTYLREKVVRLRSPSPTRPEVSNRRTDYSHHGPQTPRRTFSGSSRGEGNRLRKRSKSGSLRSRSTSSGPNSSFETWEMAGERLSNDSIRQDSTAMTDADAARASARSWEANPLSVVPDANRGIPSVPRIPEHYHFYHKSDPQDYENVDGEWHFGEAL
ncbi:hypothetical protein F4804DRAFT_297575 [Jackrogersella minutella]|nr:hypothetical protein F4804DRAFT_297575 [Jackrogersella minutella]